MSRCSVCDPTLKICRDQGNPDSDIYLLGEKPGQRESSTGLVFIGDAGLELDNTYLPAAGLDRSEVYVDNMVRCRLGNSNDKPSPAQILACASHHLPDKLSSAMPFCIILMGASACSIVPSIELNKDHGFPIKLDSNHPDYAYTRQFFGSWEGWIFPSNHPAASLHDTGMMLPLLEDFNRFRLWREGKWKAPSGNNIVTNYGVIEDKTQLYRVLEGCEYDYLPSDTENDGDEPWSWQISPRAGEGWLIFAERKDLIRAMSNELASFEGVLVHNQVHDLDVFDRMGVKYSKVHDTMAEAFHLGNLPQGLKALGWRLLGIRMVGWEDLVVPDSRRVMLKWLREAWDLASDYQKEEVKLYVRPKKLTAKRLPTYPVFNEDHSLIVGSKSYSPNYIEAKTKWVMAHAKNPEYDIWDKVNEPQGKKGFGIKDKLKELGWGKKIETPPIISIVHAYKYHPKETIIYSDQDADICGRVAKELERRREQLIKREWKVSEEDYDFGTALATV